MYNFRHANKWLRRRCDWDILFECPNLGRAIVKLFFVWGEPRP
jgi:hypothetical protein